MFFSLFLSRALRRRNQGDLYSYRFKYLIVCLILALAFLITATVLLCLHIGTYLYIYFYAYGGMEILIAGIVFCRLQNTPKRPDNVIVVNQAIPLQSSRDNSPYVINKKPGNQSPLIS